MSKKQSPNIEDLKEKIEIPVEEEIEDLKDEAKKQKNDGFDFIDELTSLGRQLAEAFESAWSDEGRQRIETEVREGVHSFVDEVDKVIRDVKSSDEATKVRTEASNVKEKVDPGDIGQKAMGGFAMGLRWLSDELGHLADQFTTPQESAQDVAESEVEPVEETAVAADDLTVINGVGPAFAQRLNDAGIYTYAQLAAMTSAELKEITKATKPDEWIVQAAALAK